MLLYIQEVWREMFPDFLKQLNNCIKWQTLQPPALVIGSMPSCLHNGLPCSRHHRSIWQYLDPKTIISPICLFYFFFFLQRKFFPRLLIFHWPEMNLLLAPQMRGIFLAKQHLPFPVQKAIHTHSSVLVCVLPSISFLWSFNLLCLNHIEYQVL